MKKVLGDYDEKVIFTQLSITLADFIGWMYCRRRFKFRLRFNEY